MKEKYIVITLLFLFIGRQAQAQTTASYAFSTGTTTYSALSGGTAVSILSDDINSGSINIGFTFNYCGNNYTQLKACSNGWITFSSSSSTQYNNTRTNMITPMLMPLWDDLSGSGCSAQYTVTGTAPNRVFTIEWQGFKWNYSSSANAISFMVMLFETTNVIQYIYNPGTATPNSPSATIGIGGNSTTDYKVLNNSSSSPTPSASTFTTNIAASPASGQVYIWTPIMPPTVTGTTTYCSGGTISLTASSTAPTPVTYSWTGPGGFTASTATITITGATTAMSGNYNCTVTSSGITSVATTTAVTVNQTPTLTAVSGTTPACIGNTLQLNATSTSTAPAATTYSWSGPLAYTSTSQNPTLSPVTPGMAGTYNVTATSLGCTATGSTNIIVNPTPTYTVLSQANPTSCTCNCGSITFAGLIPSTTYTLSYLKNGSAVGPLTITTDATGQYILSGLSAALYSNITFTLNGCTSNASSVSITNPGAPPTPTVGSNSPVCYNTPINFTGSASASLNWTWTGPGGYTYTSTGTTSNPIKTSGATFADSGNYYVYVTDASGCTSAVQMLNVVVNPRPNTPTVTTNNAALPTGICQGSTLTMTMSATTPPGTAAGISYLWTDPTGGTINPSTGSAYASTATVNVSNVPNNFAGNWVVYSVLNGCKSTLPDTFYTYIKWIPGTPTLTSNTPLCSGNGYNPNNLILTTSDTSAGVSYTWSGPNSFSATGTATTRTIAAPSLAATGTYTVYATLRGCSSATNSTTVIVYQTPGTPSVSPTFTSYCQFATSVPLSATGTNLLWHTASTGGAGSSATPTPGTSVAGLFIWYVTQSTAYSGISCESKAISDSVSVKTKPIVPYTNPTLTYCQGTNAPRLTAIGANLLWYTSSTGGTGSSVAPTPSTAIAGTFDYYVTQTVNGCESDRFHIVVKVNDKPGKPNVTAKNYCQNDFALPLSASGSNLTWYTASSGGFGSPVAPTPNTAYADTLYYYVTQTNGFGCESDRAQLVVVVDYTPNALIVANQPYVCQYDSIFFTYYGNALPSAAYNWTMPGGATILHGNAQGPLWIKFDSAGKRVVTLQVTNKKCKSPITNYIVDVRQAPYVPINVGKEVCQGDLFNISLGYANEHIDNFDWNFDGAEVVFGSEGGPYGIRWNTSGQHIVKMIANSSSCPSIPIYDTVTVHPLADAAIGSVSNSNICAGDSIAFTAERYNPAYLYQWLPANYFGTQTNRGQVYGFIEHSGYIRLQVTTQYGCTSVDSILLTSQPCCEVFFPNAFTPNGDGKNDFFRPVTRGNQVVKTFRVANRWGQVMFETVNPRQGWDGKYNGVIQDMGTYYYYLKYVCANGKIFEEKGEVLLIK